MNMQNQTAGKARDAGWAIIGAAILLCPALALAQPAKRPLPTNSLTISAAKPECVYKAVMSDAEIEACTGYKVQYDYTIYERPMTLSRYVQQLQLSLGLRNGLPR